MTHVDRREFLGWSALAAAGLCADGLYGPAWAQDVRGLPMTAAVQTAAGRVRGVVRFGVNQFWGVPYAASTAGANRFMPPAKAAPWTGVRDCLQVGNRSPQDPDGPISEVFALDRQEPMGEDCLNLNVFTPGAWQRQSAGDGVAARRRLLRRIRQLAAVRRHQPRAQGRRRRGLGDSPSESVRLPPPGGSRWRREVGQRQQRRHAGHRRRAGVDQGQHRRVRRQSRQRHRLRSIRRRRQGDDADGDAVGQGTVPSRDRDERVAQLRGATRENATRGAEQFLAKLGSEAESARSTAAVAVAAAAGGVLTQSRGFRGSATGRSSTAARCRAISGSPTRRPCLPTCR